MFNIKIITVSKSELGGYLVTYINEDSKTELHIPYHLMDDMNGNFASYIREQINLFEGKIKSVLEVSADKIKEQDKLKEEQDNRKKLKEEQKEINVKEEIKRKKALAKAIASGDEKAIFEAL